MLPFEELLQTGCVITAAVAAILNAVGCVIVKLTNEVQELASITVIVNVPAERPVLVLAVMVPPVDVYVYGAVPPVASTTTDPLLFP